MMWIDLVSANADTWNEARASRPNEKPDLSEYELQGLDLRGFDFSDTVLNDIRIVGCDLRGCSFRSAKCERMFVKDSKLSGTNFSGANLNNADFSNGLFKSGKFRGSVAVGENDVGLDLRKATFHSTKMSHAKFHKADFRGSKISKAVLKSADLRGADFRGADIAASNFSQANLTGAIFHSVNLNKSKFNGANIRRAFIERANFAGAELQGAVLRNCQASRSSFTGCDLRSVDLKGIHLEAANLGGVLADGVDFSGSNLQGCTLVNSVLTRANLIETNLNDADISGVRLWEAQLSGWSIKRVICTEAYWDRDGREPTIYEDGEFERQHSSAERIELIYHGGISRVEVNTLPLFVQHLEGLHEGCLLRLKSIEDAPGGSKVTIVIDDAGALEASALKVTIQEEAAKLQVALKRLEDEKKLREIVENDQLILQKKLFPLLLDIASKDAEKKQKSIHHISAILFMDLTGFSKLEDAERQESLSMLQGLLVPLLSKWHASHTNMWGDALRAIFANVNDSLGCACEMQAVLTAASLQLRIGMDFGEVIETFNPVLDGPDIQGDIVNMAARLEPLAPIGGVLVTDNVRYHEDVDQKRFAFEPRSVSMKKAVRGLAAGSDVACFIATKAASTQQSE
jgi:uncharacterized protein YjbI with pentapeptide repeats